MGDDVRPPAPMPHSPPPRNGAIFAQTEPAAADPAATPPNNHLGTSAGAKPSKPSPQSPSPSTPPMAPDCAEGRESSTGSPYLLAGYLPGRGENHSWETRPVMGHAVGMQGWSVHPLSPSGRHRNGMNNQAEPSDSDRPAAELVPKPISTTPRARRPRGTPMVLSTESAVTVADSRFETPGTGGIGNGYASRGDIGLVSKLNRSNSKVLQLSRQAVVDFPHVTKVVLHPTFSSSDSGEASVCGAGDANHYQIAKTQSVESHGGDTTSRERWRPTADAHSSSLVAQPYTCIGAPSWQDLFADQCLYAPLHPYWCSQTLATHVLQYHHVHANICKISIRMSRNRPVHAGDVLEVTAIEILPNGQPWAQVDGADLWVPLADAVTKRPLLRPVGNFSPLYEAAYANAINRNGSKKEISTRTLPTRVQDDSTVATVMQMSSDEQRLEVSANLGWPNAGTASGNFATPTGATVVNLSGLNMGAMSKWNARQIEAFTRGLGSADSSAAQ